MEKVVIVSKEAEIKEIEYGDVKFNLKTQIPFIVEQSLSLGFIAQYFYPTIDSENPKWNDIVASLTGRNVWYANYYLKQSILEELTNIDVSQLSVEDTLNIYSKIHNDIVNIWDFEERLYDTVEDVKRELESRRSLGVVIDKTVNKLTEIFESLQSLNPEVLKELADSLIKKVEDSPVAPIFVEASKQAEITKQTKSSKTKIKETKVE